MRISDWSSDVCSSDLLGSRQLWWIGTAVATAAGLWLALRVSTPAAIAAGIALMLLPHVIGAPHPHGFASPVPGELPGHLAAASLVDREGVVYGKRVSVRVDLGGRRIIEKTQR